MRPSGKTYRLRSIADIWALPDADVMARAFEDLSHRMVQARRYEECMRRRGRSVAEASTFTSFDWCDDGERKTSSRDTVEDETLGMFNEQMTEQGNGN